ncbi:hypothetical protein C9374_004471 [Naegleria lovaniensis]|uniref:Deacetylase sirtuin-type domain-containing protein n=1 Tax=Naegleria lovaniensis TaxID=51637 RepID=A0AA88KIS0_NAELO|nr:uncharacterized protein C9374_004471 [Naegleria lovaniensis]KAG2383134.1 hypothetical protein C9374_004471 [Naegleria lovaniensis]
MSQQQESVTSSSSQDDTTPPSTSSLPSNQQYNRRPRMEPQISPQEKQHAIQLLAQKIQSISEPSIIVLAGSGLSVASGIPDFRSPGIGIFVNGSLDKYNLPDPTAIFEKNYFMENPKPFYELRREMFMKEYMPTKSHYFLKLLQDKNKLMRLFTQNIDGLERKCGISKDLVVHCHGTFETYHCVKCKKEYSRKEVNEKLMTTTEQDTVPVPFCDACGQVLKPDIVMYGEDLPEEFGKCVFSDLKKHKNCQLFMVIGTSLQVYPVALIPNYAPQGTMRVLINRERCGAFYNMQSAVREMDGVKNHHLDLYLGGQEDTIDSYIEQLVKELGWEEELQQLVEQGPPTEL